MIKCEVIKEFTLEKFNELKNIKRKSIQKDGKLYVGDTFECDETMARYLTGENEKGSVVVKIIEFAKNEKVKYNDSNIKKGGKKNGKQ